MRIVPRPRTRAACQPPCRPSRCHHDPSCRGPRAAPPVRRRHGPARPCAWSVPSGVLHRVADVRLGRTGRPRSGSRIPGLSARSSDVRLADVIDDCGRLGEGVRLDGVHTVEAPKSALDMISRPPNAGPLPRALQWHERLAGDRCPEWFDSVTSWSQPSHSRSHHHDAQPARSGFH